METATVKVSATGTWTFVVGSEFELIDNGDSVQAAHGDRVVYVSSFRVGTPEAPVPASQIRSTAAERLGLGERFSHVVGSVQGDAEIRIDGDVSRLHGTMCADGTIATCVIDFNGADEKAWAVAVWESLLPQGESA